ncbi:MAG: shikimate dehydrogenase [Actinomycetota bacterium]
MIGVGGKTRVFCVLGHPVGHSMSPAMHNAALAEMGVDGVYVAFDVHPDGLADAVRGLQALGVAGVNCTIPHKQALLPLMDEVSEDAALIGAINTIRFQDGKRIGENTDAPGFLADLRAAGAEPAGKQVLVLGAGGSARAVVAALVRAGARVTVANRTAARAEELALELNEKLQVDAVQATELRAELLTEVTASSEIIVNTTSLGMSPNLEAMPDLPVQALRTNAFVYDLIYNPVETRLLREARRQGARGTHGAGMLARQGALALEMWTGRPAPAELMEQVILETLRRRTTPAAGTKAQ